LAEGPPVEIGDPPVSYRISYRVEQEGVPASTETVAVLRPFGRTSEEASGIEEVTFGRRATERAGSVTVFAVPPAAVDGNLGAVVADAVEHGVAETRERRRVALRECQVYRMGISTLAAGFVEPSDDGDGIEVCIDARGLILEQLDLTNGEATRRRVATSVDDNVDVRETDLTSLPTEPTLRPDEGGGSILRVAPDGDPPGRFFVLDQTPSGFAHRGRYSVVPPQGALASPDTRTQAIATADDVFVRGGDVIVVSRGGTLGQQPAFALRDGAPRVDLGPVLGEAEVVITLLGSELRVPLAGGQFVKIYGTVPVSELVELGRQLRETAGGTGLVFVD
jgi:hypothetical protein